MTTPSRERIVASGRLQASAGRARVATLALIVSAIAVVSSSVLVADARDMKTNVLPVTGFADVARGAGSDDDRPPVAAAVREDHDAENTLTVHGRDPRGRSCSTMVLQQDES